MMDFLRKRSFKLGKHTRHNPYYLPAQESHQCIANYYWQPLQPLEALAWHHLDSYAYHHLAVHLLEGDRKEDLYRLLTSSPRWLEAKFIHCNGDASYASDLDLAINGFSDPLTPSQLLILVQIHTARQVVSQRVDRYDNIDLRTLVLLGREAEAFNHVRLRTNPEKLFWGLFILHKLLLQKGQPHPSLLHELQEADYSIEEPKAQIAALGAVAYTLTQVEHKAEAEPLFAEAKQIALQIENKSQQALALKELVVPLAHGAYFSESEEIARTIEIPKWQALSLATLGASLAQANQTEKSEALFSESQEKAVSLPDGYEQAWLLEQIVTIYVEAMDFDKAEAIAQTINHLQKRVEAMSKLGSAFMKAGLATRAEATFTEAEVLARSLDRDYQQAEALQTLAKALAQAGQYAESERVALTIEVDWAKTGAFADLSAELAQAEQFAKAERIANMIQDNGGRAFALRVLALVYARTGNLAVSTRFFQQAGAIAPTIEDHATPIFALVFLAMILRKAGYAMQAEQVLQESLVAAQSIQNDIDQKSTLKTIAVELARQHIFSESEKFAQVIQDPLERAWAFRDIALSLAQAGCKPETSRIFAEIEELAEIVKDNQHEGLVLQHKGWVLAELSKAFAQVVYFAEAERVAHSIEASWKQHDAFTELSKALTNNKQFSEAERIARASALKDLAISNAQLGRFSQARAIIESIDHWMKRYRALTVLARELIQAG